MKEAQLWDEFQKLARYDGEDRVLKDRFNNMHAEQRGIDTGRPEIDRKYLRDMLLDAIPSEYFKWGHHLKTVDEFGTLYFASGNTASGFDLVVGADGAWSKIQRLLSTVRPFYSGISAVELWTEDIELAAMVGNGSHFVFGNETGRCLLTQRQDKGVVRTLAYMRVPDTYQPGRPWHRRWQPRRCRRVSAARIRRVGSRVEEGHHDFRRHRRPASAAHVARRHAVTAQKGLHSDRRLCPPHDALCRHRRQHGLARRA